MLVARQQLSAVYAGAHAHHANEQVRSRSINHVTSCEAKLLLLLLLLLMLVL